MNTAVSMPRALPPVDTGAFRSWQEESRLIDSMQVVFIVGPQRTGTTWLVQMLAGHPNAVSRCEGHIASDLLAKVLPAIGRFNAARPDHAAYCRLTPADSAMLARQIIDRQLVNYLRSVPGKPGPILAVIDKTPPHAHHIDLLASLYPAAKFIGCVRDVRDAAVSSYFNLKLHKLETGESFEAAAMRYAEQVWARAIGAARAAAERIGADRYAETSYEDRTASPEGEAARLLRFIGLDASDGAVAGCVRAGDFEKITGGRKRGEEAVSHYRKAVVGDWRNHFTKAFAEELVERAEAALAGAEREWLAAV